MVYQEVAGDLTRSILPKHPKYAQGGELTAAEGIQGHGVCPSDLKPISVCIYTALEGLFGKAPS